MVSRKRRQYIVDKVHETAEELAPSVEGIVLAGSLSYAPDHEIQEDSDVDLVIIAENEIRYELFRERGETARTHDVDPEFIRFNYDDEINMALHLLTPESFSGLCSLDIESFYELRDEPKDFCYIPSFDGTEYCWDLQRREVGAYHLIDVPYFAEIGGRVHSGPHQNMLLSYPSVIFDEDGRVGAGLDLLWDNICEVFEEEVEHKNFYHIFKRLDRFSESAKEYISRMLKNRIERPGDEPKNGQIIRRPDV